MSYDISFSCCSYSIFESLSYLCLALAGISMLVFNIFSFPFQILDELQSVYRTIIRFTVLDVVIPLDKVRLVLVLV